MDDPMVMGREHSEYTTSSSPSLSPMGEERRVVRGFAFQQACGWKDDDR